MLTQTQNFIVYLMFLNGILFLGLNFVAYSIVFPGKKGSKRIGYVLIVAALLAFGITQEYRLLFDLEFEHAGILKILLGGFVLPIFLISLVYYRIQRSRSN